LEQGKKKSVGHYGHEDQEWGFKDDSEKREWEEHYKTRNGKWRKYDVGGEHLKTIKVPHCSENCLFESVKNSKRFMPLE
jgi:hypothetical protein